MFQKTMLIIINQKFGFLIDYGFTVEKYQNGGEIEFVYSNFDYTIFISHYKGKIEDYGSKYYIDLIIKNKNESLKKNLLECYELFGKDKLDGLRFHLHEQNIIDQIETYRRFLESNINNLI